MIADLPTKNELIELLPFLTEQEREEIDKLAENSSSEPIWQPNPDREDGTPNPQRLAVESKADILGYGGAGGGGKTDLLIGLAGTQHNHSVIFRRVFKNLRGIIERSREVYNPEGQEHRNDSFNESLHRWRLSGGKLVEFEACQYEKDKEQQRGRPRDFYGFDEVTEFSRSMVEFIIAWNRSTIEGQRCRVVMTFNPPIDSAGSWVIEYFLPWLAYLFPAQFQHEKPAAPGELRWYATIEGEEVECKDGESFEHNGELIRPLSRTFIPAKLDDNPHLANTNYRSILQALPEPLRSQMLYGDFAASTKADPWQVIPTAWVKAAQQRWMETEKPNTPLMGVGVDVARGGKDSLTISKRYGNWFDEVIKVPGVNVEDGPTAAGMVYSALEREPHIGYINIDIIGVGTSPFDSLKVMYPDKVVGVNAAGKSSYEVKKDGTAILKMRNIRAEYYWRFREALDPEHGAGLALPPGNEIVTDLCAARWILQAGGVVQIEPKEDIKDRIGHSPDVGEAVLLCNYKFEKKHYEPAGAVKYV